ncbi:fungal-specific transcription factor domain-containing protein [Bisporella sp. PMI_857]|nr:fungal-specific transcription factor domain-containing protein [Bisporella sp. PMI_857]
MRITTTVMQNIRACDTCRKRKVRCESAGKDCLQCIHANTHCIFTPTAKRKTPRRPAGYKHVEELKIRLERMEGLLKASGKMAPLESTLEKSEGNLKNCSVIVDLAEAEERDAFTTQPEALCVMPIAGDEISENISNTIRRPHVQMTKQSVPFKPALATTHISQKLLGPSQLSTRYWNRSPFIDISPRIIFQKLPPLPDALSRIEEGLKSFNTFFPIFDAKSFMEMSREKYLNADPSKDPGWWACLNIVLAMAHRFRAMRTSDIQEEDQYACGYMQNTLAVVPDLLMMPSCLSTVQALLATTIILRGTPNYRLCPSLIAATIRAAQDIDLHKQSNDSAVADTEIEQQKLVFWIAYVVDKDISLRTGKPPGQDDDDIDVDLPISDLSVDRERRNVLELLEFHIGLAIIQGQTYKKLYSVRGLKQPEAERLFAAQELASRLAIWKNSVPTNFETEFPNKALQTHITPVHLHYTILHLTYANCLIAIHRPFLVSRYTSDLISNGDLTLQAFGFLFDSTYIYEARRTIGLFRMIPQGDYYCTWLLIQVLFAAVTTVLHNVLLDSSNITVQSDLDLTEPFLKLLEFLLKETHSPEIEEMYKVSYDLNRRAREAAAQTNIGDYDLISGVW